MNLVFKNENLNLILQEVSSNEDINKDCICSICKDRLLIDTITLNCNHKFHSQCLQETFIKYQPKRCPLCSEVLLWDSYKTKCITTKKSGDICNKICYNDERMCNLHGNTYLRALTKVSNKQNVDVKKNLKKIDSYKKKIKKLKAEIVNIEKEIDLLEKTNTAHNMNI